MTQKRDCKPFDLPSLEMSGDVFGGVYFLKWHHLSFLCLSTLCLLFQNVLSLLTLVFCRGLKLFSLLQCEQCWKQSEDKRPALPRSGSGPPLPSLTAFITSLTPLSHTAYCLLLGLIGHVAPHVKWKAGVLAILSYISLSRQCRASAVVFGSSWSQWLITESTGRLKHHRNTVLYLGRPVGQLPRRLPEPLVFSTCVCHLLLQG